MLVTGVFGLNCILAFCSGESIFTWGTGQDRTVATLMGFKVHFIPIYFDTIRLANLQHIDISRWTASNQHCQVRWALVLKAGSPEDPRRLVLSHDIFSLRCDSA